MIPAQSCHKAANEKEFVIEKADPAALASKKVSETGGSLPSLHKKAHRHVDHRDNNRCLDQSFNRHLNRPKRRPIVPRIGKRPQRATKSCGSRRVMVGKCVSND
jgi:hypothetical protein